MRSALLVVVLLLVSGCLSSPAALRASTLAPGEIELGADAQVINERSISTGTLAGVGLSSRWGVREGFDFGFGLSSLNGFELSFKLRLLQTNVFVMSAMVGGTTWNPLNLTSRATGTLLMGVKFGEGHEVVLAPDASMVWLDPTDIGFGIRLHTTVVRYFVPGTTLSAHLRVSRRVTLFAAASARYAMPSSGDVRYQGLVAQGGIGVKVIVSAMPSDGGG